MPDSEFFSRELTNVALQASFDGRLKQNEGFKNATGDLTTLTAGAGKDLYIVSAKVQWGVETTNTSLSDALDNLCELKLNGTVFESSRFGHRIQLRETMPAVFDSHFKNMGHKVAATQVIKLEVIAINVDILIEGFIECIEVPTGLNPLTYRGA